MSRVFFDTNLFIYLLEDQEGRGEQVNRIIHRIAERNDELLTSAMTLGEVLVKPIEMNLPRWAARYEEILNGPGVTVVNFDQAAARIHARLRAATRLKSADAIQLACAAAAKTDLFITSDDRLTRLTVPGIQFIAGLDHVWM